MARTLFHALRIELDVDPKVTVDLASLDALDADNAAVRKHVALISLLCTQLLHHLGDPEDEVQKDEIHVLVCTVDVMLLRLRNGTASTDTAAMRTIREIHERLMDLGW